WLHGAAGRQPRRPQASGRRGGHARRTSAGGDPRMRVERLDWDGTAPGEMAARLRGLVPSPAEVTADVEAILAQVRARGDAALADLAERFGEPAPAVLRVDPEAVSAAPGMLEPEVREALRVAASNVKAVAQAELEGLTRATIVNL